MKDRLITKLKEDASHRFNLNVIKEILKSTDPVFNRQYHYYNLRQQHKQSASITWLNSDMQENQLQLEDNLVQRFSSGTSDQKLGEKILETSKEDLKIQYDAMKDKIRDYESNMAITSVRKPQANSSKKLTSNPPASKPGSRARS